jgi:hypothetical protein
MQSVANIEAEACASLEGTRAARQFTVASARVVSWATTKSGWGRKGKGRREKAEGKRQKGKGRRAKAEGQRAKGRTRR